jgi:polysaccharide export outer membrane protein
MKKTIALLLLSCGLLCAEPAAPSVPAAPNDNYRLVPDDLIQVKVFREDDMDSTVRISKDGTVSLPLIGLVQVGGKTTNEASAVVRAMLDRDYIVNPQVTITVMEVTRQTFTILGQVQKPGSYKLPVQGTLTLLEAIGRGGGYTRIANPANVTVKRQDAGRDTLLKLNAKTIARVGGGQPFLILPGDTITVGESLF